jgi:hypothetical protein
LAGQSSHQPAIQPASKEQQMTTILVNNTDTGSINLPKTVQVGSRVKIQGRIITCTYVMQSKASSPSHHCCFKGSGLMPVGEISVELVDDKPADPVTDMVNQMNATFKAQGKPAMTQEEEKNFRLQF